MSALALVTGAPGWLGTRLAETLIKGLPDVPGLDTPAAELRIRCLVEPTADIRELTALGDNIDCVRGDLTAPESLSAFFEDAEGAVLYHSAASIHPQRVRDLYRVNVHGARALLEGARAAGVGRFVHVSSTATVGLNRHHDEVFGDDEPCRPYMGYGRSKFLAEEAVRAMADTGDLETVICRLAWFYGPRQPPRQTEFFSMIRDGKAPLVAGGKNRRSMAYIDNICQGMQLAARAEAAVGQTYWLADRRPYAMHEVIDTVETILERDFDMPVAHRRLRLPALASTTARGIDGLLQSMGLYVKKIHVLGEYDRTIAVSIEKAERELGYNPRIALEEGMRRSIAWALEHGGLP
jgi:nucleoside-diphosphate-sugar epimerase